MRSSGGILWTQQRIFTFHKRQPISWWAEWLSVSEVRFGSNESAKSRVHICDCNTVNAIEEMCRFSQRCCRGIQSSGMWLRVVGRVESDLSKDRSVVILRVKEPYKNDPEEGGTPQLRNDSKVLAKRQSVRSYKDWNLLVPLRLQDMQIKTIDEDVYMWRVIFRVRAFFIYIYDMQNLLCDEKVKFVDGVP